MRPYANLVHPQILGVLVVMWPADARAFSRPTSKAREKRLGYEVENPWLKSSKVADQAQKIEK